MRRSTLIAGIALAGYLLSMPAAAQFAPSYQAPRTADGHPNLNGIWQALTTANWDIRDHEARPGPHPELEGAYDAAPAGQSIVEGNDIPYQPSALAKKKENFEKRMTADPFHRNLGDPEAKCYVPGVPRATYMPFPFQIVQSTNTIVISYEFASTSRIIHMDKVPPAPVESWMGHSVGHWEGDTLVVNVTDLNDQTWFDRAGNFHSDALHVVERFTRVDGNTLNYQVTFEDPTTWTRPWTAATFWVKSQGQIYEYACHEGNEGMVGILSGGREEEKAAQDAAKKGSSR